MITSLSSGAKRKGECLISVCCSNAVSSSKKQGMCQEGCSKIGKKGTTAINRLLGSLSMKGGVPFPIHVFQEVEYKTWSQRDVTKFLYYARNKSLLCLAGKMEKNLHIDRIASYIPTVNIKEKSSI